MLDLAVVGGSVVTPSGTETLDVGIVGEQIVMLAAPGRPMDAATTIDAAGAFVIPGGVDPHVHTSWIVPTAAQLGIASAGPEQVSRAAAYGGTTTLIDFAFWRPGMSLREAFDAKQAEYAKSSYVDFAYHGTFRDGTIPFETLGEICEAIQDGHASYKVWMTNTTPSRPRQKTDFGDIWGLLQETGRHGGILAVHAEDDDIVMYAYRRLQHEGRVTFDNVHLAHNNLSEAISFQRIITLADHVGAPIYLMHVSAAEGVHAVAEARSRRQPVYGETLQHYASFTHDDYRRPNGAIYHTYPSLKSADDRDALWAALADGTLSSVATDEMCTTLEMKVRGETIDDVTGGHAGVEVRMGLMYTEAVRKRGLSMQRYVDITSANAARIFGLYPRKGAIAIGSDADLVLLETFEERPIKAEELHETDYSPWDGWLVEGWPRTTILRGQVIVRDGTLAGTAGQGRFARQAISAEVLRRPSA